MGAADKLYNGNIAETFWRTATDGGYVRNYGYKYDSLNRLKDATYQKSNSVTHNYDENLTYDKNGNIVTLLRYTHNSDGQIGAMKMDELTYDYKSPTSNQLMKVTEGPNGNVSQGFIDGNTTGDDYVYDANGNMTVDKNKGITAITYNHLNLPTKIVFGTTGSISYVYSGSGQKVQKVVTENTTVTTTDYLGGYQYKNTVLQFFPTVEGYVKNTLVSGTNSYSYVFNYTDHLGNVRLSYTKNPSANALTILEESNYYPFGLKHNGYNIDNFQPEYKYQYNGKELQDELQLNLYDFGARNYDPAIVRFTSFDPVLHYKQSPYVAFYNNPVYWADPTGMTGEHYDYDKRGYYDDAGKSVNFETAMASQGLNTDGSEKKKETTKDDASAQVGILPESFDFKQTTGNWQAAGVTGLSLTVTDFKTKRTAEVQFELEVGVPMKLANGTIISERIAQLASAEAANATAGAIGTSALLTNGKFYNAPALVKLTFALLMQRNLNQSLKNMLELPNNTKIGSRVNSTIQSNIKTKEAVWAKVSALEAVKLIFKGFF